MKRLTKRICDVIELTHGIQEAVSKLAHYEDLEEKCIEETTFGFATLLQKWKEFQDDIAQWLEWRELAKNGQLVELPCPVGETLWRIVHKKKYGTYITSITLNENNFYKITIGGEFGKTVFRTLDEAKAAMKGE